MKPKTLRCIQRVRFVLLFSVFAASALVGCSTSAQTACMDAWKARNQNLTHDEQLALFYGTKGVGCIPEWFFTKTEKDAPPQIAYRKIKLSDILDVDEKQLKDLDVMLDPKNEEYRKLLDEMGIRPYFEAQERALKFRVARLKLKLNHEKFKSLMGESNILSYEDEKHRSGYDVRIFLPDFDPLRDAPFNARYVDEAKQNGKLRLIEKSVFFDHELLGKKEQDPEFVDDPNRFVWKPKTEGIEVDLYKVMESDRPHDKAGSYLEATRVTYHFDNNGAVMSRQRESKPAMRVFVSSRERLDILVLDTEREEEFGFGSPDIVEQLASVITTGKDLYLYNQTLVSLLFGEKEKDRRQMPPPPKAQDFKVAVAGTSVDPWEKSLSSHGWTVSIGEYRSEKKDNYHIDITLKRMKHHSNDVLVLRQIDYFKKVYHMPGNPAQPVKGDAVEYYRPLPAYGEKNVLEARVDYSSGKRKKVVIEREGQPTVSGIITPGKNAFIEEKPFRVDYTEGEKRWRLEDRDKNGVFSHRMEISMGGDDSGAEEEENKHNDSGVGWNH